MNNKIPYRIFTKHNISLVQLRLKSKQRLNEEMTLNLFHIVNDIKNFVTYAKLLQLNRQVIFRNQFPVVTLFVTKKQHPFKHPFFINHNYIE